MPLKCAECGYEPSENEVSMRSLPKCPKCGARVFIKVSLVNPRVKSD